MEFFMLSKTITPEPLLHLVRSKFDKEVDCIRCLLLYTLIYQFSTYKKNKDIQGASIPISYLRALLGGKAKTTLIISTMKTLGVIKCKSTIKQDIFGNDYESESYLPGKTAKTYCIQDKFLLTPLNKKVRTIKEKPILKF
jgi:hypothetical protein